MATGTKRRFSIENLRIWQRLAIGFGLMMAIIVAETIAVEVIEIRIQNEIEDIVSDNSKKTELLEAMSESVHQVGQEVPTMLLLREDRSVALHLKKFDEANAAYDKAWSDLQKLPASEEGKKIRERIQKAQGPAREANARVLKLAGDKRYDEALEVFRGEADKAETAWQAAIDEYVVFQQKDNEQGFQAIKADFAFAERMTLAFGAIGLMIAILVAWWNTRTITRPIATMQHAVEEVRSGNFAALQAVTGRDEVADLGRTVNQLLEDRVQQVREALEQKDLIDAAKQKAERENELLNEAVIDLLKAVHQLGQRDLTVRAPVAENVMGPVADSINGLAEETGRVLNEVVRVARRVERATHSVRRQADAVNEVAAEERRGVADMVDNLAKAVEHMNLVAELADSTNKAAEQAAASTSAALERVTGTVKGMGAIRETIAETEKRIKRLGERSQEIGGIVNLINTISERTHMLALNASMQAAIAGEAGRGFAVVAEEVQRLAESSRNATSQIATLVNNIQLETNETIGTVNKTIGEVVEGSALAQKAGEQMQSTQSLTANLADLVQRIAAGASTQKAIAAQLKGRVDEIGRSTEKTAGQVEAQVGETVSLAEAAKQLASAVGQFKLPHDATPESDTQSFRKAA